METKHDKVIKITRRIILLSLGLIFVVKYFDKGNYSNESVVAVIGLVMVSVLSVFYRCNYEITNGIFDLKKYWPMIVFLILSIMIFIFFAVFE